MNPGPREVAVRLLGHVRCVGLVAMVALACLMADQPGSAAAQQGGRPGETVPGMPPVVDPSNLYSETRSDKLSPAVANALPRVYVPNLKIGRASCRERV